MAVNFICMKHLPLTCKVPPFKEFRIFHVKLSDEYIFVIHKLEYELLVT